MLDASAEKTRLKQEIPAIPGTEVDGKQFTHEIKPMTEKFPDTAVDWARIGPFYIVLHRKSSENEPSSQVDKRFSVTIHDKDGNEVAKLIPENIKIQFSDLVTKSFNLLTPHPGHTMLTNPNGQFASRIPELPGEVRRLVWQYEPKLYPNGKDNDKDPNKDFRTYAYNLPPELVLDYSESLPNQDILNGRYRAFIPLIPENIGVENDKGKHLSNRKDFPVVIDYKNQNGDLLPPKEWKFYHLGTPDAQLPDELKQWFEDISRKQGKYFAVTGDFGGLDGFINSEEGLKIFKPGNFDKPIHSIPEINDRKAAIAASGHPTSRLFIVSSPLSDHFEHRLSVVSLIKKYDEEKNELESPTVKVDHYPFPANKIDARPEDMQLDPTGEFLIYSLKNETGKSDVHVVHHRTMKEVLLFANQHQPCFTREGYLLMMVDDTVENSDKMAGSSRDAFDGFKKMIRRVTKKQSETQFSKFKIDFNAINQKIEADLFENVSKGLNPAELPLRQDQQDVIEKVKNDTRLKQIIGKLEPFFEKEAQAVRESGDFEKLAQLEDQIMKLEGSLAHVFRGMKNDGESMKPTIDTVIKYLSVKILEPLLQEISNKPQVADKLSDTSKLATTTAELPQIIDQNTSITPSINQETPIPFDTIDSGSNTEWVPRSFTDPNALVTPDAQKNSTQTPQN